MRGCSDRRRDRSGFPADRLVAVLMLGLVALEATGGYERLAFALLWSAGLATAIVGSE